MTTRSLLETVIEELSQVRQKLARDDETRFAAYLVGLAMAELRLKVGEHERQ